MYIAPSSGHISLNCNMPFKFILRRFEVDFWCMEWECCTFWKIDGYSFKSTNTILWLQWCTLIVDGYSSHVTVQVFSTDQLFAPCKAVLRIKHKLWHSANHASVPCISKMRPALALFEFAIAMPSSKFSLLDAWWENGTFLHLFWEFFTPIL